jgi:hypothetical protein
MNLIWRQLTVNKSTKIQLFIKLQDNTINHIEIHPIPDTMQVFTLDWRRGSDACLSNRPMQTQSHVCTPEPDANNTNPHRVTSQSARWSAAVSSLVISMANHATASTSTIRCAHVNSFPIVAVKQTMLPICDSPIKPLFSRCNYYASISSSSQTMRPSRAQTKLDSHSYTREIR